VAAALDTNATYSEAHALYNESIALARATGNLQELARGLLNLGTIAHVNKAYSEARYYYEESIRAADLIRSRRIHAIGLTNLGDILLHLDELPAARQALEAALALKQTMGDQRSMIYTLNVLAGALHPSRAHRHSYSSVAPGVGCATGTGPDRHCYGASALGGATGRPGVAS
jgi:tetratricopeptide (TPR) repeat protein